MTDEVLSLGDQLDMALSRMITMLEVNEVKSCYDCEVYQYHSTPRYSRLHKSDMTCNKCPKIKQLSESQFGGSNGKVHNRN